MRVNLSMHVFSDIISGLSAYGGLYWHKGVPRGQIHSVKPWLFPSLSLTSLLSLPLCCCPHGSGLSESPPCVSVWVCVCPCAPDHGRVRHFHCEQMWERETKHWSTRLEIKLIREAGPFFFSIRTHTHQIWRHSLSFTHIHTHFSTVAALWSCRHFLKCLASSIKTQSWTELSRWLNLSDFCVDEWKLVPARLHNFHTDYEL